MKLTVNLDDATHNPLPHLPMIARHLSVTGPLCIVNEFIGHGEKRFHAFFLEGHGGPAINDQWGPMPIEKIEKEFIPVKHSITLANNWR